MAKQGKPKDIATVERDADTPNAWNAVLMDDDARVTFGALDKEHAQLLADSINRCSWVQVLKRSDR